MVRSSCMSESLEPELLSSCKWRAGANGTPTNFRPGVLSYMDNQSKQKSWHNTDIFGKAKLKLWKSFQCKMLCILRCFSTKSSLNFQVSKSQRCQPDYLKSEITRQFCSMQDNIFWLFFKDVLSSEPLLCNDLTKFKPSPSSTDWILFWSLTIISLSW